MTVRIALAQFAAGLDVVSNAELSSDYVFEAAKGGAQLVVLPENAMYSDPNKVRNELYAESLNGQYVSRLKSAAKATGTEVVAGITEDIPNEIRPSNTLVHISSNGRLEGVYRKIHLYDAFGAKESDRVLPASEYAALTFEMNGLGIGAMTCYDLRFPEMARFLVDSGADVILVPTAWHVGPMKEAHWDTLLRARAIENTAYVLGVGQTGPHCTGQSMAIDPQGVVVASAGEMPGVAFADVSGDRIVEVRKANPSLVNRRFSITPSVSS